MNETINIFMIFKALVTSGTTIIVLNSLLLYISKTFFNIQPAVLTPVDAAPRVITYYQIVPESFVMPFIGIVLYIFLAKLFAKSWMIFIILVCLITAAWTVGPLTHGVNAESKIFLSLTHVIIAAAIIGSVKIFLVGKNEGNLAT